MVLAMAGGFWVGLSASALGDHALLYSLPVIVVGAAATLGFSLRLRRSAGGFNWSEVRTADKKSLTRKIMVGSRWVTAGQSVLVGVAVAVCWSVNRIDLLWPVIALIVSVHFVPLGWLYRVRPYYVIGLLGSIVALGAILDVGGKERLFVLGLGEGIVVWACAIYLLARADRLADQATGAAHPLA
jgi:hypothetical protein